MRDLSVGILGVKKRGKNVERAGFSVVIVEHCVRECRGMESIGLLHLTLSSLSVKWHHRQLQGPLYDIGFLNKSSITSDQLNSRRNDALYIAHDSHHFDVLG